MKEPGYLLLVLMFAISLLIFFSGRWVYRKMKGERWFRTKTFMFRFIASPIVFIFVLWANYDSKDARILIFVILFFGIMDRVAAWFDRNVPDSDPRKMR